MIQIPKFFPEIDLDTKLSISIVSSFAAAALTYMSIFGFAGRFGDVVGSYLGVFFGRGAGFLPIAFLFCGMVLFRLQKQTDLNETVNSRLIWGVVIAFIVFCAFLSMAFNVQNQSTMHEGGGLIGYIVYPYILGYFGFGGAFVILIVLSFVSFFLISQMTFTQFLDTILALFKNPSRFWDFIPDAFELWKAQSAAEAGGIAEPQNNIDNDETVSDTSSDFDEANSTQESPTAQSKQTFRVTDSKDGIIDLQVDPTVSAVSWRTPPIDILKAGKALSNPGDINKNKGIIKDTLAHFGIVVEMKEVQVGPTVSQYSFKPANGVKLSAIDNLQRDLGLALATPHIRVEAPIRGKSLVGVEIPNPQKAEVTLRQIVDTKEFLQSQHDLLIAIGKDVSGNNITFPLTKMPHLLVAGSTGSGKSVWINGMLLSLMVRYSPEQLQIILVDMKRVELKLYEGVPHLLCPVITDSDKAINALKWCIIEMEKRYKSLELEGKRNISDYNAFARAHQKEEIPYLVVIIDELGELMMVAKSEVEPIIVRLTQLSRAVGIHLVVGTQRPDTHVVTGLIKANIPSRIAFAVATQIDSRVILDQGGAEKLLGQGDGLFINTGTLAPIRFQAANVSEREVRTFVTYLKEEGQRHKINNLDFAVTDTPKVKINVPGMVTNSSAQDSQDEYFEEARKLVIDHQKASASFLQQMMGIGYPKAARIIQQLEDMGVVGPQNGSKPREVYGLHTEE